MSDLKVPDGYVLIEKATWDRVLDEALAKQPTVVPAPYVPPVLPHEAFPTWVPTPPVTCEPTTIINEEAQD